MSRTQQTDIEEVVRALKRALRHGCRAARLMKDPAIVHALTPNIDELIPSEWERAVVAERRLRLACQSFEGPWGDAMEALLGLAKHAHGLPLWRRRELAASLVSPRVRAPLQPDTFRRHYEKDMLSDIAVELLLMM